jgi:hypothetical protein
MNPLQAQATRVLHESEGLPLSRSTVPAPLREAASLLPRPVLLHTDRAAQHATALIGAHAFCADNHVVLGSTVGTAFGPGLYEAIAHELAHVAQVEIGRRSGRWDLPADLESEADRLPPPNRVARAACPETIYGLWWLLPLAAAAYVLLRPNVANAPGPGDKTYPSVSEAQVTAEALALFAVPEAAFSISGRVGLGLLSRSAIAGASATVSMRGVQDVSKGKSSGAQVYLFDAATGAVIGVVVPGGIRLIGTGTVRSLDWLATQGVRRSDLAITDILAKRSVSNPASLSEVGQLFARRGLSGRAAEWWLNRRGVIVLYRGQGAQTTTILSPLAREHGVAASEALAQKMRGLGITDDEIAKYVAFYHTRPVPPQFTLPQLANEPLGAVGIPATQIPGVAANFGGTGVVYVVRLPKTAVLKVPEWGLSVENEWVVLNQIPEGSVVNMIPANQLPALEVTPSGKLGPGTRGK